MHREGMIVAPQPEAAEAGAVVLQRGGNAVDATIAAALVQTVVDPQMCGIAGFGSLQLYCPGTGVHTCIDAHGRCPTAVTEGMWADCILGETRDGFGFILRDFVNECGYQAITTPGILRVFAEAAEAHGTWDWRDLVAPAIAEAKRGVTIRPHLFALWNRDERRFGRMNYGEKLGVTPAGRAIYLAPDGGYRRAGQRIDNPDMAHTLQRIADEGAETLFTGALAGEIDADMRRHGALMTGADLASYRTQHLAPLWGEYRGHRIATNNPPGGGIVLLELLHILEGFDLAALGHNSPRFIQVMAEAMKCVSRDKEQFVSDPRFVDVPVVRLTSKQYGAEIAAAIRAGERFTVPRLGAEAAETTHISCMDAIGNVVSLTHSLGTPSGVVTEGHGFMYNGCMAVFDPRPGRTGSIAPGKSRFASMAPTIVFKGDQPIISLGAPGGTHIPLALAQVLVNMLDFGMSMSDAVIAPRMSATSALIDVCNRIPRYTQAALEAEGYQVERTHLSYAFAAVHGIALGADGRMHGGADPQRDGMALAVPV